MSGVINEKYILISALEHYSYCPRQYALIYLEQEFADNEYTLRGRAAHILVDQPDSTYNQSIKVVHALPLFSEQYGLIGKADTVEFLADGTPYPIEYKYGRKYKYVNDDLQLAAQAVCLEEMFGKPVLHGAIFHVSSHRRREVDIDDRLRQQLISAIAEINAIFHANVLPRAVNDSRCKHCSLYAICQPKAMAATKRLHKLRDSLFQPEDLCNKS